MKIWNACALFFYGSSVFLRPAYACDKINNTYLCNKKIQLMRVVKGGGRREDLRFYVIKEGRRVDFAEKKQGAYTIETLASELTGQSGNIVAVGVSVYAMASAGGKAWYHDNFYCWFVDTQQGAVLRTYGARTCLGGWKNNTTWITDDGDVLNFSDASK